MTFTITCGLEDPDADSADRLLPYLAIANVRQIEARDSTPERAVATVKGILLHWLAGWDNPPNDISFKVTLNAP